ncbi:3-phosphoshikimate 1-carboxyvinyltransferase [Desulforhabdus amnigena]|jgi:3-phosphoshikimate 1-carboxyvinyltransferase|uniref:3-phosphoshikimate 1-carboxyvinyltransferase n=1 Tax=Desulforhabdus amnigena TaxID=40218 RepID=A0A9W6FV67_9BACT|nr:3-phosphoshikimate 1-carboxyvinyltransferase [Desulforhabdus amnigena]NLJ28159.1 3-phosphoshikimate 1-carboxyvinyltransferase [Deltaproteobacteria bacterium]GLI35449.1 3-phosphoshikimate 1-carboxyvinyltransferase 2 [Desulforhabdus amnigena]
MSKTIKKIEPVSRVKARIRLPGSKSVTHRALLMAALAQGESQIKNPLVAEDTLLTAKALEQLGAEMQWGEQIVRVIPAQKRWKEPHGPIFLGNSGTSTRLLLAVAATGTGEFLFDGSPRLRERPIGPILEALKTLGVQCQCLGQEGYPPVKIISRGLAGGEVWVDAGQSSQFLSALLIASPCARKEMRVGWHEPIASFPYVALTLSMMEEVGIEYRWSGTNRIIVPAPQPYPALKYTVEGDCSSASYFWAAAALTQGEVYTHPISPGSSQGDCRLLEVMENMGCRVQWEEEGVTVSGPERLKAVDLDMNKMPDMVPTIAVLAAFAEGHTRIRNVAHLRVKESDRLHVVAMELSKLGVPVRELPDGLEIDGGHAHTPDTGLEAHDDHRIAMAFALAGLCVKGVEIHGAESVAKSFPTFWDVFAQLQP